MNNKRLWLAVLGCLVFCIGVGALVVVSVGCFMLARSSIQLIGSAQEWHFTCSAGGVGISSNKGSYELHWLGVVILPLLMLLVIGSFYGLRKLRFNWRLGGVMVVLILGIWLVLRLTAPKPDDWLGKPMPKMELSYLQAAPELKGHPLIVEFWATWCGPCVASMPHLSDIQQKYRSQGLVVLGLTDETRETVEAFLKKQPVSYSIAFDKDGALRKGFGINGIPHAFLVDKTGKILWHGHPTSLKAETVEAALH